MYFKADLLDSHFLSLPSLPFHIFVFTLAEIMSLLPGLCEWRSAQQQSLMEILSLKEREVLKLLKKILAQP